MPWTVAVKKRIVESEMCFNTATRNNRTGQSKCSTKIDSQTTIELYCPILPGLPDDVAKFCLALVPRSYIPVMGAVSKRWRSFIQSKEFITVRKEAGKVEEWIYVLTADAEGKGSHWEILDPSGGEERRTLPSMPGPVKAGFGVVVLHGKLLVMAGYSADVGTECVSADVYQYDSLLNSWTKLAEMNVTRFDFGCAEVNGVVYVVGGYGANGESLSSAEVYNPEKNEWTLIESLRRPRWGCFACSLEGKLFVMGGRSSFTIGHSKFVDVYSPERHSWLEMKNGCVMVTAHAVIGRRLFCLEWKNQRKLSVFDPTDNSWHKVEVPLTGSSAIGFCFGILDGKLLLFSMKKDFGYRTLVYDPEAERGSEWKTTSLEPSGLCLCSVTIKA
ncbi:F-box/kelch-repeat protein-like [Iris pallida]|uniref:F-box/kelch-repeat protein-like n=1 Tax=Iris pallida TaxID=29817 RepID=A0AAX6FRX8_IRIPA|nr:F-box/kelch-repeat protein-like [Iris pallida]